MQEVERTLTRVDGDEGCLTVKFESLQKINMTQSHFIEKGLKVTSLFEEKTQSRIFIYSHSNSCVTKNSKLNFHTFTFLQFTVISTHVREGIQS